MLQLIPPSPTKQRSQSDASDISSPEVSVASHFKRNSLLNLGFQGSDEDNTGRKKKIRQFLEDFNNKLETIRKNGNPVGIKEKIKEHSEPLYAILDHIFCLYNINIQIISQDQSDSAIRIEPTIDLGKVVQCLASVAIVLSRFPYSFIKLIDLNKFTVCRKAQLKKGAYEELFTTRILTNSMFMLDVHDTHEKIEHFFYRVVLFHAKKKLPTIHSEWPVDRSPKNDGIRSKTKFFTFPPTQSSSPMRNRSPTIRGGMETKAKPVISEELKQKEQQEIFCRIMADPRAAFDSSNSKLQVRALFLKEQLETIDPVGIYKAWWDDLRNDNIIVNDAHDQFSLKL